MKIVHFRDSHSTYHPHFLQSNTHGFPLAWVEHCHCPPRQQNMLVGHCLITKAKFCLGLQHPLGTFPWDKQPLYHRKQNTGHRQLASLSRHESDHTHRCLQSWTGEDSSLLTESLEPQSRDKLTLQLSELQIYQSKSRGRAGALRWFVAQLS